MPCLDRENERARFVDGTLSPTETENFAGHLGTCPSCRAACESLKVLRVLLRGASLPPIRPDFDDAVVAAWTVRRQREARNLRWTLGFAVTVTSVIAVVFLANLVRMRGADPVLSYLSAGWELSSTPGYSELLADHQARLRSESP